MSRIKVKNNKKYKILVLYLFLAIVIGIVNGLIISIFGLGLNYVSSLYKVSKFNVLLLPIIGVVITLFYEKYGEKNKSGMANIFLKYQKYDDYAFENYEDNLVNNKIDINENKKGEGDSLDLKLVPLITISTWLSHLFGASVGREGVAVQIGATIGDNIGKFFTLDKRIIISMGIASGFSALFRTPLAATIFALEVIISGRFFIKGLIPSLISSYVAYYLTEILNIHRFQFHIGSSFNLTFKNIGILILFGICIGILGMLFSKTLKLFKDINDKIKLNKHNKILILSIPIVAFVLISNSRYVGLGTNLINLGLNNNGIYWFDFILKFLITIYCISIGYQGGEVTPLFSIGVCFGYIFGVYFGLNPIIFSALGYCAMFLSATNTFITPIFIGIEVYGIGILFPLIIVCIFAYLFNANASIYGRQKIINTKINNLKYKLYNID